MYNPLAILRFRFMVAVFRLRDWWRPRREVLQEVGIRPGFRVLDFGCGTGSYIRETARLVGESGQVYALDINPLAIEAAKQITARYGLGNVKTILSECATGLPDESVDLVLLCDVWHGLIRPNDVLKELHRVLKRDGFLSFSDHHLSEKRISEGVTEGGLFILAGRGRKTYRFTKIRESDTGRGFKNGKCHKCGTAIPGVWS
jgi:ubiquinone/menaquinone biosynthesis C-methylase UbiE